jgi:cation-transporting ATPase 13A3/4/5
LSIASYCILIAKLNGIVEPSDIALKFFDLITITVPPGLPVSMTIGIIFAVEKLKSKGIFCISPNKIISGGRVKFACFDKTGTLTEDFMDFYGLVPCHQKKF